MPKVKTLIPAFAAVLLLAGPVAADGGAAVEIASSGIAKSLTGKPGDAANGEKVFLNRKQGNCLACHQVTALSKHPFHGEIGPSLDGVADRYSEAELRQQVVDPKTINPDTIMPSFFKKDGLHRVRKKFQGKTLLSAEQVEDIVAYLKTFK